uniref:Uncharacterized protein n=1 Tax=Glossina pallidipes TaxID=7398 RepID=A0A1A9ZV20_GLOPL
MAEHRRCEEKMMFRDNWNKNGSENEELIECCNKVEVMMEEANNIDAPERDRGDKKNKTIVDIIFEDFSTTPFNSPASSPERNLERSPLFILREKPKRFYSRKKKMNSKESSETPYLDYNDIEKKDIHIVSEDVVETGPETGISEKYNWNEDDNDLFLSISTQEILDQNDFPSNQRSNVALGEGLQELGVDKNEFDEVKNKMHQDEVGKVNNPVSSLVSAGFETANGKKISISEAGQKSVQNILREFQGNLQETDYETELKDIKGRISMESKFRKTANSSAQIKTGFHAANTKRGFQDCLQEKQDKNTVKSLFFL